MIGAVVFDIGNVLIEWQPERYYDRVIGAEARKAMFAEVDLHGMNDIIDRGGDFRMTVYDCAERHAPWSDAIRLWHDDWLSIATPVIPHSVRLMEALQAKGVPVLALTNFGVGTWEIALPAYPFLARFDRAFVSGLMRMAKPEPEIYAMLEAQSGMAPEALLFTDDRADNIAAAEARGWRCHRFTGPEGWAARLVSEGLLTEEESR